VEPNFSGVWKLIRGECDFAFLAPPRLRVDTILHSGQQINIRTRQKDTKGDLTIDRDLTIGGEAEIVLIHGRARLIRAYWEAAALVLQTDSEVSGNLRRIEDRFTLDNKGEWLTVERHLGQPGGAVHQRLRLRRAKSPQASI
jgi:hypothetical protein